MNTPNTHCAEVTVENHREKFEENEENLTLCDNGRSE